ncbi:MAG: hypothetical protein A3H31_08375 [Gallionellales bacterium RIFCSPLOWO2_02_FULL_57_47]|nr:MAG: hypothetical protein A3H31_08375 [Gallionellales bacterium RIFCSPLOWO2_02_FULL_57_47]
MEMNLHLFFDVFIEDAQPGVYLRGDRRRFDKDYQIRTATPAYKFQSKFDITRYSLISYQEIPWASITIRIECQNKNHESIYEELRGIFPDANVVEHRSDTAKKYYQALLDLDLKDNSWVFFSPNNDHPFMGNKGDIAKLAEVLKDADEAAERTGADLVSIPFSHFTECMNFFKPTQHEWGAYGDVFPKLLYETNYSYVISLNKLLIDSLHIYRYADLKWIFGNSKNTGRVIRPEDTEFYLTKIRSHVMVVPKFEFCRHYDGYMHIADKVPPLFIPEGFFDANIRIRYGYENTKSGYVNINPRAICFSYQSPKGADLKIVLDDIPEFWRHRISEIDINPEFPKALSRLGIDYYKDLVNPWRKSSAVKNIFRSYRKLLKSKTKQLVKK